MYVSILACHLKVQFRALHYFLTSSSTVLRCVSGEVEIELMVQDKENFYSLHNVVDAVTQLWD